MPGLYLTLAIGFEVIGTIALKWSAEHQTLWPAVITAMGYITSFFFLWLALKSLPVSFAYATWSGVGVALTAIAGVLLFAEKIDLAGLVGLGLIIAGIVMINGYSALGGHG